MPYLTLPHYAIMVNRICRLMSFLSLAPPSSSLSLSHSPCNSKGQSHATRLLMVRVGRHVDCRHVHCVCHTAVTLNMAEPIIFPLLFSPLPPHRPRLPLHSPYPLNLPLHPNPKSCTSESCSEWLAWLQMLVQRQPSTLLVTLHVLAAHANAQKAYAMQCRHRTGQSTLQAGRLVSQRWAACWACSSSPHWRSCYGSSYDHTMLLRFAELPILNSMSA